jgi:hypothetical protein
MPQGQADLASETGEDNADQQQADLGRSHLAVNRVGYPPLRMALRNAFPPIRTASLAKLFETIDFHVLPTAT